MVALPARKRRIGISFRNAAPVSIAGMLPSVRRRAPR